MPVVIRAVYGLVDLHRRFKVLLDGAHILGPITLAVCTYETCSLPSIAACGGAKRYASGVLPLSAPTPHVMSQNSNNDKENQNTAKATQSSSEKSIIVRFLKAGLPSPDKIRVGTRPIGPP